MILYGREWKLADKGKKDSRRKIKRKKTNFLFLKNNCQKVNFRFMHVFSIDKLFVKSLPDIFLIAPLFFGVYHWITLFALLLCVNNLRGRKKVVKDCFYHSFTIVIKFFFVHLSSFSLIFLSALSKRKLR